MLRIRSLGITCAREVVRSGAAARGGGKTAAVVCHAVRTLSDSSQVLVAPQPPPSSVSGHDGRVHSEAAPSGEEGIQYDHQLDHGAEKYSAGPRTDLERSRVLKDAKYKIRGLARSSPSTKGYRAMRVLDEARREGVSDLSIYKTVFKQLLSVSRVSKDAAAQMAVLRQWIEEDSLEIDVKTYNDIIDFYAQVHDTERAQATYEEMLSKSLAPDQKTLSHLIMAHSWGNTNAMYRVVEELNSRNWEATRGAYQGMIAVMARHHDWEGVLHTIGRMRAEGKRPTEAAFVAAFRAAHNLERPDVCRELFQHRMEVNLPRREYTFVKVMATLLGSGRAEESLEYWRQLVCINGLDGIKISDATYNLAIKCAATIGNLDEVEAVLEMMQAQGIGIDDNTYLAAMMGISSFAEVGDPRRMETMERAFRMIGRRGPPPGLSIRKRMGVDYAHGGLWQEAIDVFENVLSNKPNMSPRAWKCLFMAQHKLGKHAELKASWVDSTSPKNSKITHSAKALDYASRSAACLGDLDWALELREMASKAGCGSIRMDTQVAKLLTRAGKLEEAHGILKMWTTVPLGGSSSADFREACALLLSSCKDRGAGEMGLRVLEVMSSSKPPFAPDASSLAFVLTELKTRGRPGEVVTVFEEVCSHKRGIKAQPDAECYAVVAEAAFEAGDRVNTIKYCEKAEKEGVAPSEGAKAFAAGGDGGGEGAVAAPRSAPASVVEVDDPTPAQEQR